MNKENNKSIIGVFAYPIKPDKTNVAFFYKSDDYFKKYSSEEFEKEFNDYCATFAANDIANNIFAKQTDLITALEKSGAKVRMIFPTRPTVDCVETRLRDYSNMPMNEKEIKLLAKQMKGVSALVVPGGSKHYPGQYFMAESLIEMGFPYLGICAGCQLLASINKRGKDGGIFNDIVGLRALDKTNEVYNKHIDITYDGEVEIIKETPLYKILGKDKINVKWTHGLVSNYTDNIILPMALSRESAHLEDPDLKENIMYMACYVNGSDFQIGVQWHPEKYYEDENNKRIFDKFVEYSKTRKPLTNEDINMLITLMIRQQTSPKLRPTRRDNTYKRMLNSLYNVVNNSKGEEKVEDIIKRIR